MASPLSFYPKLPSSCGEGGPIPVLTPPFPTKPLPQTAYSGCGEGGPIYVLTPPLPTKPLPQTAYSGCGRKCIKCYVLHLVK